MASTLGSSPADEFRQTRPGLFSRALSFLTGCVVAALALAIAAYTALFVLISNPGFLFEHRRGSELVTFHSTSPLPDVATNLARDVTAALLASPLGLPEQAVDIWLIDEGWPARVFFAASPHAAGLTYPVASTSNVFLRHADLPANRLMRGDVSVPSPRTLSYFVVHEMTHLMVAERVGRRAITRMPLWISEGFADYVALGPAPSGMVARTLIGEPLLPSRHGTYGKERVCVTLALEQLSGDIDALFAIDEELAPNGACPMVPQFGIAPVRGGT